MPANATRKLGHDTALTTFTWNLTDENPEGIHIPPSDAGLSDRAVQVFGALGGGVVRWLGTSDPSLQNWHTLTTTGGEPVEFAEPGIKQVLESTLYARPVLEGAGEADCTVILVARRPTRG